MLKVVHTYHSSLNRTLHYFTFFECNKEPLIITDLDMRFNKLKVLMFGLSRLGYIKDINSMFNPPYRSTYIKTATITIFQSIDQLEEVIRDLDITGIEITKNYNLLIHDPNTTSLKSKISSKKVAMIEEAVRNALAKYDLIKS